MKKSWSAVLLMVALGATAKVGAENAWSTKDYDFYSGDFDGDGFSDLLYVARRSGELSGITLFDGAGFNRPLQSWGNAYLGIPWSSGEYRIVVGDFNGDGKDDLFLQRNTPGDHYLLLAEDGGIGGIYQAVPQDAAGVAWSADQHEVIAGDFNGDGRSDLFLQPIDAKGLSAIILADSNGQFTSKLPDQSWDNGYAGFMWAKAESLIFAGDFDASGQDDLLIQAQPLPGTGPGTDWPAEFLPNTNGVVLAQNGPKLFATEGVQAWSQDGFSAKWSPLLSNVVTGDFNGDQHADVLLQAQTAADKSYLLYGKSPGAIFRNAAAMEKDAVPAADEARITVGRFSTDRSDAMYFQSTSSTRGNTLARIAGTSIDVLAADVIPAVVAAGEDEPSGGGGVAAALAVTAPGRTPGQFGVSSLGGATYQIPIWTPSGARGIDPNLALVYASGGPDGPLGPGWNLAGLSAIARCAKTYASSAGAPAPIALTTSDDVCLDGSRLRKTSGTQLVAGSTYQTEIEIFSRVTAYGAAGNGPSYFIVEGKDGLKYEFGNTADSKAYANGGSTPYAWMLSKVLDRQGNNLKITYSTTSGDVQPSKIEYTQTPATGTAYPYSVDFTYQTRVTNLSKYVAGGNIQQTKVLSKIDVKHSTTSVRQYLLDYQTAPTTQRDRLASVQECGGSAGTDCLRPTTISYQNGTSGVPNPSFTTGSGSTSGNANSVDIDGDGRMDLVYATLSGSTYTWRVKFATSSGFGAALTTGVTTTATDPVILDDFDGNGRVDLLTLSGGVWFVLKWTGSAFTWTSTGQAIDSGRPPNANWDFVSADVNGDGLPDLVSYRPLGTLYTRLNSTVGGVVAFSSTATLAYTNGRPVEALYGNNSIPQSAVRNMDFNDDGRGDVVITYLGTWPNLDTITMGLLSQGTTFVNGVGSVNNTGTPLPVYWNDDRCTDLAVGGSVRTGDCGGGYGSLITATGQVALDWDGDGRTDLLGNSGGILQLHRSLGTTVASPVSTSIPTGTGSWMAFDQNGDGLADLAFVDSAAGNAIEYGLHNGASTPADLATTISDGWGISASPTYVSIAQSSSYTKGSNSVFPNMDFQGPLYVVSQAVHSDGRGGTYSNTFSYYWAQVNRQGRGFQGFDRTRARDSRNNLYQDTYYQRDFPYTGQVRQQDLLQSNGTSLINRTVNEFAVTVLSGTNCNTATSRCFPYISRQTATMRELTTGSPLIQTAVTDYVYDSWGNPTSVTTTTTDNDPASPSYNGVWTSTVTNVYTNNVTNWCFGLPTRTDTQNTAAGQPSATRRTDHTVNAPNCRFLTETIEPLSTTLKVATTFGYDTCGNVSSVSAVGYNAAGTALPSRATTSNYGTRCTFAETITNPLSQVTSVAYNYNFGVEASATDPNGVVVSWLYDNFARRTRENRADGTYTTFVYEDCVAATCWGLADLRLLVTEAQYSSASTLVRSRQRFVDGLERLRIDQGHRVLGVWTSTQITYDSLGRQQDVHQPYTTSSNNGYHRFAYDDLDRPISDSWYSPSGSIDRTTSIAYAGLKATYTDAQGVATQKWTDVTGKLRRIIDPSPGGTTNYTYDSFGNLKQIQDATSKLTTYTYNIRGFKTAASDPDTGSSTFTPNSLNELDSFVNANGQTTTFTYDKLGRMLTRLEPESATPTTWVYGTSAALKEIGKLKSVSKPDGYGESYTFDSLGRPAAVTFTEDTTYQVNYTYNNIGALDVVTYPTSTSGYRLAVKHNYSYGFLQQVKDNASSATYWTLNSANDYASPVSELLGNAVTTTSGYEPLTNELTSRKVGNGGSTNNLQDLTYRWDDNGNLDRRQDLAQSLTETITYDALNRLKTATVTGGTPLTIDYDAAGNITSKSDVGSYDYVTNQAGCSYTGLPAQPHAVRNAGGVVYCYDKNGNMIKRGGSTISWYSYDQPNSIASGSNSTQFNYNADHQRWRQVAVDAGATTTTYYVGGILEKVIRPTGVTEYRHLIPTGSGTAIYIRRSDASNNTYYITTDHLGSGDLVLSSSGTVLARESFTPYGERRGSNWQGLPSAADKAVFADVSRRGFTGHEMLDAVGLVNMNGRVYDPRIGRFLSVDPIIPTIGMSQALNPYTYVMNNPLTLIDPSGYSWLSKAFSAIGKFFKRLVKSALQSLNLIVGWTLQILGYSIPGLQFLIPIGVYISSFPVHVTYRSGRFGIGFGYKFVSTGEAWSFGGRSAAPPSTWGSGYSVVGGVPVLSMQATPQNIYDGLTSSADSAVDYWIEQNIPIVSPIMGTLAATMTSEHAPATISTLAGGPVVGRALGLAFKWYTFARAGSAGVTAARSGSRALTAADFGSNATLKALEGTFTVERKLATVSVRNIEGNLGVSGWDALNALKSTARAAGATTLRIEGTIGNPAVLRAMERLLGPAARGAPGGAQDIWIIRL